MKLDAVKRLMLLAAVGLLSIVGAGLIRNQVRAAQFADKYGHGFNALADEALTAMKKRAGELKIGGVAVVAYFEGDDIKAWSSKMVVVGKRKDEPSTGNNGANLVGIAYTKAAEMADGVSRRVMLSIAESYEILAQRAGEVANRSGERGHEDGERGSLRSR